MNDTEIKMIPILNVDKKKPIIEKCHWLFQYLIIIKIFYIKVTTD